MTKTKETRGRPRLPDGEHRSIAMSIRFTPAEHKALRKLAKADSRPMCDCLIVRALGKRFS